MPSRRPLLGAMGKHVVFFDGVDDYVEVPHSASLNITNELTIEALIYAIALEKCILIKEDEKGIRAYNLEVTGDGRLQFVTNAGEGYIHTYSADKIAIGRWVHVATTYLAGTVKFYIDGKDAGISVDEGQPTTLPTNTAPLMIGKSIYPRYEWQGYIGFVLIYNRALNDDEIAQTYKALKDFKEDIPVTDGLVLGLTPHSLDCENGIWNDISGNNNNATLYGARCLWI